MSIEPVPNSLKACLEHYKALLNSSNAVERILTEDLKETEIDNAKLRLEIKHLKGETQEPVAFTNADEIQELKDGMSTCYMYKERLNSDCIPLYTHPAPSWQGLSDDELSELLVSKGETSIKYLSFARAIEQASRNKNGY